MDIGVAVGGPPMIVSVDISVVCVFGVGNLSEAVRLNSRWKPRFSEVSVYMQLYGL